MEEEKNLTIGDVMQSAKENAGKTAVIVAGILVYVAGVIYAEIHGYSILTAGIDPEMLIWAVLGVVALGITALALPVALKVWTHDPTHRMAALGFYGLDLLLMGLNAMTDFTVRSGGGMASWQAMYLDYVASLTPIICALGWSLLFMLDPAQKAKQVEQSLKSAVQVSLANRLAQAAKSAAVNNAVDEAAAAMVSDIIGKELGITVSRAALPKPETIEGKAETVKKSPARRRPWLNWNFGSNGARVYEQTAEVVEPAESKQDGELTLRPPRKR